MAGTTRPRCLIIESDDVWAGILRRALDSVGVDAVQATGHEHALGQLRADSFDLITLDMSLDHEKRFDWGRQLLAALKIEDVQCPPVIVVSGTRDFEHVLVCLNDHHDRVRYFASKEPWDGLKFLSVAKQLVSDAPHTPAVLSAATGGSLSHALARIRTLVDRFHMVVRELDAGKDPALKSVADERDVQRLLRALLALEFDDVRPEDPVSTVAGAASRVDFILPEFGIVVETKMTRSGLTNKKLGEELIVDITRYRSHPACRYLFCFVYDPAALIDNPRGIESDLARYAPDAVPVEVAIRPRSV